MNEPTTKQRLDWSMAQMLNEWKQKAIDDAQRLLLIDAAREAEKLLDSLTSNVDLCPYGERAFEVRAKLIAALNLPGIERIINP